MSSVDGGSPRLSRYSSKGSRVPLIWMLEWNRLMTPAARLGSKQ